MNVTNHFDISRFWLLMKMELLRNKGAIAMTVITTFGLLFFMGFLLENIVAVGEGKTTYDHHTNYASAMLIGGFIISSLAFNDLGNTLKGYQYLTLPVSTLEKFLCMWILTSAGWIALFTTLFILYTFVSSVVGHVLFPHIKFLPFDPLGNFSLKVIRAYFVLQGIFLVGSVHFKGYSLLKTLFTVIVFTFAMGIIAYFVMKGSFFVEHECTSAGECEVLREMAVHPAYLLIVWLFWWIFAPLCWVITYVGLKEKEV